MGNSALVSNSLSALADKADFLLEGTFILLRTNENYLLRAKAGTLAATQLHQLRQRLSLPNRDPDRGYQQIVIKRRHPCSEGERIEIELAGSFAIDHFNGPFRLTAELDSDSGDQLKHAKERFGKAPVRRAETHGQDIVELMLGQVTS